MTTTPNSIFESVRAQRALVDEVIARGERRRALQRPGVFVLNAFTDSYAVGYHWSTPATYNASPTRVEHQGQATTIDDCNRYRAVA